MKIGGVLLKSDNALRAEDDGRFPASEIARRIGGGLTAAMVKAIASDYAHRDGLYGRPEYHHVGKFANEVDYFDLRKFAKYVRKPGPAAKLAELKREARAAAKASPDTVRATVKWIDWSGTRKRPIAVEVEVTATVALKGDWATCTVIACIKGGYQPGQVARKKISGKHFEMEVQA